MGREFVAKLSTLQSPRVQNKVSSNLDPGMGGQLQVYISTDDVSRFEMEKLRFVIALNFERHCSAFVLKHFQEIHESSALPVKQALRNRQ